MTMTAPVPLSPEARFIACDPELCVGCQLCEFACATVKDPHANILKSRIRVARHEPSLMVSVACRGCYDPACVRVCPQEGALTINFDNRLIDVDNDICDGCGWCINVCPFGAVLLDTDTKRVVICDLCAQRDNGAACVEICPKDALEIASIEIITNKANGTAVQALVKELNT